MYQRLLEARGKREREPAKRREIECIGPVDETRARYAARVALAGASLGIVARVFRKRVQVAANHAGRPVAAEPLQRADSIRQARLAKLSERALFHAVVV